MQPLDGVGELLLGGDQRVLARGRRSSRRRPVQAASASSAVSSSSAAADARRRRRLRSGAERAGRPSILSRSLMSVSSPRATWAASRLRFFGSSTFISS